MAIIISDQPESYTPAYNPMVFVCESDNNDEDNFQYVFDIYWNSTFQTRHKIPARPTDGKAIFDPKRIIEAQITHNIDLSTSAWGNNPQSYLKYYIKFGEEYDVAGVSTVFPDLVTSNNIYAYNSVFDFLDFVEYTSGTYLLADVPSLFLTNAPNAQSVRTSDKLWLYSLNNSPASVAKIQVKTYNSLGVLQSTVTIANTFNTAGDDNHFLRVGVGPWNILQSQVSTFFDNISYYTVQALNGGNVAISELRRFNIDSTCSKYTNYRLHFLNKLGGFDAFNFSLVSQDQSEIKKSSYTTSPGTLSSGIWTYSKSDLITKTMDVVVTDSTSINSNWITDSESTWLKELVTSPLVFWELAGTLIPITITEPQYQTRKTINGSLINLKLSFNHSTPNYRQRY